MKPVKEISIVDIQFEKNSQGKQIEIKAQIDGEDRICYMNESEFARELSSIIELTEDEIQRRTRFSLTPLSLPLDEILGKQRVTNKWISRNF